MDIADKVIAVDGKTSRRSFDGELRAMHMVSAFVSELGITLGQQKTAEKSNEITAIPALLELLDIEDAIITLDAMGCQTKIAETIIGKEADYVFGLKGNQGELNEDVRTLFATVPNNLSVDDNENIDAGHGRLEIRCCRVVSEVDWLKQRHPHWSKHQQRGRSGK